MDRDYIWEGEYGRRSHLIPVFQQLLRESRLPPRSRCSPCSSTTILTIWNFSSQ